MPGTSFSQDVAVPLTFTTAAGTPVDCSQPRSCQIGLVRLAQDATVSSALVPLTFG